MNKGDPFPPNNAKVGDVVWFRRDPMKGYETNFTVVEVGLPNDSGYNLNFKISNGTEEFITGLHGGKGQYVFVLPPKEEWEKFKAVTDLIERHPNLVPIRDSSPDDDFRYKFACSKCHDEIQANIEQVESMEIRFWSSDADPDYDPKDGDDSEVKSGFSEGKPSMENSSTVYFCNCVETEHPHANAVYEFHHVQRYM